MVPVTIPMCVGINALAPATFMSKDVAGHTMVQIPGGHTVIGSADYRGAPPSCKGARPEWIKLSPYFLGETVVSNAQYRDFMERPKKESAPDNHPATMVSHDDAIKYLRSRGAGLRLPTAAEWENGARGPALNIPKLMEAELGQYRQTDVVDFVDGRFENLVFKVGGDVFTDPQGEHFQRLISAGHPFFGWRIFGTTSGRLDYHKACFGREHMAHVDWGPRNGYGLFNMTGNVWEWVQDAYERDRADSTGTAKIDFRALRGGSWRDGGDQVNLNPSYFRVANYHCFYSGYRHGVFGFRVAASFDKRMK